jgi:hypothetical protein
LQKEIKRRIGRTEGLWEMGRGWEGRDRVSLKPGWVGSKSMCKAQNSGHWHRTFFLVTGWPFVAKVHAVLFPSIVPLNSIAWNFPCYQTVLQKKSLRTVLQTDKQGHYSTDEGDAEEWGEESSTANYTPSHSPRLPGIQTCFPILQMKGTGAGSSCPVTDWDLKPGSPGFLALHSLLELRAEVPRACLFLVSL